ncbi:hypothetical protein BaRGS_00000745 [Batillaria attramentaria]|uniref:Uncharacterized protein n=1 Tax=Batillaria attramentaria TaxID=370345 RepID=A0ABD0M8E8_9CAEN
MAARVCDLTTVGEGEDELSDADRISSATIAHSVSRYFPVVVALLGLEGRPDGSSHAMWTFWTLYTAVGCWFS